MIEITAAVQAAKELDTAVGLIAKVVGKLKAQPDVAAQKLGEALGEVAKTLQVVDDAASTFLSLGIDDGALEKNSKILLAIDGGSLSTEVERGRGHCHVIGDIYSTYLDRWFQRVLAGDEYLSVSGVFNRLGYADDDLFADLATAASTLEKEASAVLDLVVKGDKANARTMVLATLPALRPLRKTIAKTMQTLYSLKAEFVDITGTA